jgi:NAD(P)H-dependent FMN reductase
VTKPVLQVIIGSTRPGRVGRPVADWIIERARARGDFEVVVSDLADYAEALRPLRSSAPGPT